MIKRDLYKKLKNALERQPAVILLGPRQVGKTTLALDVSKNKDGVYLDLESYSDLNKLEDPLLFFQSNKNKLLILDEIQRMPDLFLTLRGLIDERRREGNKAGHYLLLGSASLDLIKQSSETLAGRVAQLELAPLNLQEVINVKGAKDTLWVRGGFPESFIANRDEESYRWRLDFIKSYLEKDIPQMGPNIPAETLRRFWTMLAHMQGTNINFSKISSSLGVSNPTVTRYADLLVDLLLVRRLQPYHINIKKRLVKSPKTYIRDSGLLHALLGIKNMNELLGNPIAGSSWEGYVIENIISCVPEFTTPYYYKTSAGAEIDLILEMPNKELWAIEIKKSLAPKISHGFYSAVDDVKPNKKFIIYSGNEKYLMKNDIEVIGLFSFLQKLHV